MNLHNRTVKRIDVIIAQMPQHYPLYCWWAHEEIPSAFGGGLYVTPWPLVRLAHLWSNWDLLKEGDSFWGHSQSPIPYWSTWIDSPSRDWHGSTVYSCEDVSWWEQTENHTGAVKYRHTRDCILLELSIPLQVSTFSPSYSHFTSSPLIFLIRCTLTRRWLIYAYDQLTSAAAAKEIRWSMGATLWTVTDSFSLIFHSAREDAGNCVSPEHEQLYSGQIYLPTVPDYHSPR